MGLFDVFRRRSEENPAEVISPPVDDVLLRALLDGEPITREKALTLPAVAGAVDFVTNSIASMPVKLYKYTAGKTVDGKHTPSKVEEVEDDTRTRILNGDTGDTLDAFQMKKARVMDFLLGSGGYAYIRRDRNEVTGLFYVEDERVATIPNYEPIFKKYLINVQGNMYYPWEFIKILRNTKDGASGVGVTEELSKAIEAQYQTLLYQLNLVRAGGGKKGFVLSEKTLAKSALEELKAAWRRLYSQNSDNVVVLNNGLKFQEASASSVEMQLNESKKTFEDEINSIFHIYPADFQRTYKEAIYPIVKAFETALNRDLLLEREKGKYFFEFDVKEILRMSLTERYNAYKTAKETGFLTLNEIRRAENLNYVEGLDVVNVGLGAVLFDVNTGKYYTPNTDTTSDPNDPTEPETPEDPKADAIKKVLTDKVLDTEFEDDGNSSNA